MIIPLNSLGIFLALVSAIIWGGGDFSGGYATRRDSQYHVLAISALSGLVVLIIAAFFWQESFPSLRGILYSVMAGAMGALGIAAFYRALATEHNASIAPTTAVIGAAMPVLFTAIRDGLPSTEKIAGFFLAFIGIWLVSSAATTKGGVSRQGFLLSFLAGIGFGGFFIFIGQVDDGKIFTPLIVARCLTFCTGIALIKINRLPAPSFFSNKFALLAGVLDAGGNLFYILAKQFTRLDVAAILSSLYPASTVLLACLILKEEVRPLQWLGVLVCLGAITMIML